MGLFNSIFGKPTTVGNPFFGQMHFISDKKNPSKSYFECSHYFKPKSNAIEIAISANIEGPEQKQIDFFESIENDYSEICNAIIPLIEDEFRNWKDDFKIVDFKKEFDPVYLSIPRCDTSPITWEIAFESEHDKNHTFTLMMEDFTAKAVLIDG